MMRIITGTARGTKLLSLEGNATRPTSERAKEAMFSMLAFDIAGKYVLDLFAGSGQLALEALSRGAAHATMVDSSPAAIGVIRKNTYKTHMTDRSIIVQNDCTVYLNQVQPSEQFDLIFVDPPYANRLVPEILTVILQRNISSPHAIFVCESEEEDIFEGNDALRAEFVIRRVSRYAKAVVTILERKQEDGV